MIGTGRVNILAKTTFSSTLPVPQWYSSNSNDLMKVDKSFLLLKDNKLFGTLAYESDDLDNKTNHNCLISSFLKVH